MLIRSIVYLSKSDKKKEFADDTAKTNVTLKEDAAPVPEQHGESKSENVANAKEEVALEMGEAEANESNIIEKDSVETVQQEGQVYSWFYAHRIHYTTVWQYF